ncbi:helix-turn-helix transcriptional regulator [Halobaculum gomorrense]|uniref:IclR helix-turn-helix domain-containing protein n=1 Tax=Halobaculum gomorrense TaxID=43928 RepID=A0A1M5THJ9_9EURY|nr:hypothetical protein [Halobaculum gomorrense]SHH50130.1 hypothetical protein SAMN05443636_2713 [Halobaculum gomorrense]
MADLRRRVLSVLAVMLLVSAAGPVAGTLQVAQVQPEADNTATRIQVYENGTAHWTIRIRTRLTTARDVEQFQVFQMRIRNNSDRHLSPFRERMRGVVNDAANATGREMTAGNFTISTRIQEVPRRWGVVVYEFTWTDFAVTRPDSDAIIVSDVFGGGFFITANDTLTIAAPTGYRIDSVSPAPDRQDAGTLTWVGRVDFADDRPRVRFKPNSTTPTSTLPSESTLSNGTNAAEGDNDGTGDDGSDGGEDRPLSTVLVILGVLGALGVAGLLYLRRIDGGADKPAAERTEDAVVTDPTSKTNGVSGAPREQTDDLLTDGDRVRTFLQEHGGRVRQKEIVEAFGWSDSKTSRVVSRLTDEGEVKKLRIGRENVISLPDTEDD